MIIYEKLSNILKGITSGTILDLGAGNGKYSVFCASYGHNIIALDNESKANWKRPTYLEGHPLIKFTKCDITKLPKNITSPKYELILLFNVIPFIEKKLFINKLLPQYINLLKKSGKLLITFFFNDDKTFNKNISFYNFEDFTNSKIYKINEMEEYNIKENHPPQGEHTHHIGYLELEKL